MQYYRPQDKRGLNVFETTKDPGVEFTGFKLDFGAGFTSQVQNLIAPQHGDAERRQRREREPARRHRLRLQQLDREPRLHAQLAPGIRVALTSYLSSRHHNETWVKDGYIQIDESPIDFVPAQDAHGDRDRRASGHFEINYGDAHFRRSDNGNAVYNPFVGNYIMDAFTTEIGGEVYLKASSIDRDGRGHGRRDSRNGPVARPARSVVHRQARLRPADEARTSASG